MEFVIVRDVSSPGSWGDADKKSEIDLDDDFSVSILQVCPQFNFLFLDCSRSDLS